MRKLSDNLSGLMNEEQLDKRKHRTTEENVEQSKQNQEYWDKVKAIKDIPNLSKQELWFEIPKQAAIILSSTKKEFIFDDHSKKMLRTICLYFSQDKKFLNEISLSEPSLEKGLLLTGTCGTGKTLLMQSVQRVYNGDPDRSFKFTTCGNIVSAFNRPKELGGDKSIAPYKIDDWYFDDFGSEEIGSHFGKVEVMKEIFLRRYEMFIHHGTKTYMTSNLDLDEIAERYGDRVISRIKEMFNIIVIGGNDRRK